MSKTQQLPCERIYIKAEPSGEISVAKVPLGRLLEITNGGLSDPAKLRACQSLIRRERSVVAVRGLFTRGVCGEQGNLGLIKLLRRRELKIPKTANCGRGYLISLALSKVSIEFDCPLPKGRPFETDLLIESCIPIDFPSCVQDDTYGGLQGNVCIGYRYRGKKINDWADGWVDRGFKEHFFAFYVGPQGRELLFSSKQQDNECVQRGP